ncbi:MAG: hypothetical protein C0467_06475 [Planctomycetaceae bacterium]|nr:hypothetical protein [Planctomycetaceae bacterium]
MPGVVMLMACVQVIAQPAPTPDAGLIHGFRDLAGQSLHISSQGLELLSDPRVFWLIESQELAIRIGAAVRSAEAVDKHLAILAGSKGLTKDDAAGIARLRKLAGFLKEQGESLQTYWDTGVVDHWKLSEAIGKKARKELDDLLDLNPKTGLAPPPREPRKRP